MRKLLFLIVPMLLQSVSVRSQALNADELFYSKNYNKVIELIKYEHPEMELYMPKYTLIDIDRDGINELWVRDESGENGIFICRGGDNLKSIALEYGLRSVKFFGNVVCEFGSAGSGALYSYYVNLENSSIVETFSDLQLINYETEEETHECGLNGEDISYEEFQKIAKALPKGAKPKAKKWMPLERLSTAN